MTLDEAIGYFDHEPSDLACSHLLQVATRYFLDGMIEEGTYLQNVLRVAEWLRDDEPLIETFKIVGGVVS